MGREKPAPILIEKARKKASPHGTAERGKRRSIRPQLPRRGGRRLSVGEGTSCRRGGKDREIFCAAKKKGGGALFDLSKKRRKRKRKALADRWRRENKEGMGGKTHGLPRWKMGMGGKKHRDVECRTTENEDGTIHGEEGTSVGAGYSAPGQM